MKFVFLFFRCQDEIFKITLIIWENTIYHIDYYIKRYILGLGLGIFLIIKNILKSKINEYYLSCN